MLWAQQYGGYCGAGSGSTLLTLSFSCSTPGCRGRTLAVGMLAGPTLSPVLARQLPERLLRWVVGGLGLVLALGLWLRPG